MQEELARITDWLITASSQIGHAYIQLPVAGQEEPEYRERVYCYELYFRWRFQWPDSYLFSLSGEIDKGGHPLIRESPKPDFLVHVPGSMTNLLVMEIKPKNADVGRMVDDLIKLTKFRRELCDSDGNPANYHAAYFWVYGTSAQDWPTLRDRIRLRTAGSQDVDHSLISSFVHEAAGVPAVQVDW